MRRRRRGERTLTARSWCARPSRFWVSARSVARRCMTSGSPALVRLVTTPWTTSGRVSGCAEAHRWVTGGTTFPDVAAGCEPPNRLWFQRHNVAMTDGTLTDAQIMQAWDLIHARADDLVTRGQQAHLWPVAGGSALGEDDRRSDPWRPSHAASAALSASLDHLHALSHSLTMEGAVLHARAPFTLARGAIENAATALWIVHAPKR